MCKEFLKHYYDKIIDVLPSFITESKLFKFELLDDDVEIISPKFYNFTSDKCYCKVLTNLETMNMIKWYTLNLKGVDEYLIDNHSSYDGFISLIKNYVSYWKETKVCEYQERYIVALFDMLLLLSDKDSIDDIHNDIYENINKFDYVVPMVEYENKDYSLSEFKELMCMGC